MAKENKKVWFQFFKKYGYYLLLVACILVLAFIITFAVIYSSSNKIDVKPVNTNSSITFTSPVLNGTIIKGYSDSELQYNQTLKQWEAHFGLDYSGSNGANVVACYDGVIESVSSNTLDGSVVKINHGNGLVTIYKSLSNVNLVEGASIKQGDIIGQISTSASKELKDGEHVHFEVWKDGSVVDPSNYLNLSDK